MHVTGTSELQILSVITPIMVALIFITLTSLIKEPARRNFMAIMVGGAGSVYISGGGMGAWELVFATLSVPFAYLGLRSYRFIGVGWLLHTAWDVVHHLNGHPIIPFLSDSSFGCAVCDPVIAIWCFAGASSLIELFRGKSVHGSPRPV